jgi:LuxR family transcriptional regulator, quorum-sensing system regulator BjaR1
MNQHADLAATVQLGESMVSSPVFQFAATAMAASDMETVDKELTLLLSGFGIDHFVLYQATDRGGKPTGARLCGKRHDEWRDHYVDADMAPRDDLMKSGKKSLMPTTWSRFQSEKKVSKGQKKIFNEASDFGLKDGFYLPLIQPDGSMHGVSMMVQHKMDNEPRMLSALHLLAIYYSIAANRLGLSPPAPPSPTDEPVLTDRQIDCLQWIREGLTPGAVGDKLGITEYTVNEHLQEARRRLHVRTTAQAVIEAINHKLISL